MKKSILKRVLIATSFVFGSVVLAQVPQLINYQGRIAVAAENFTGEGQFKFALVDANGASSYWSNDGLSSAGSEPVSSVTLTVSDGLYSVLLGDTGLANMTAIPAGVFANSDVYVRVWFNDGSNGSQLLTPDQRIASVGYAMLAGEALTVADGAITLSKIATGGITSDKIATGAVTADGIATGAVTADGIATGAVTADGIAIGAVTADGIATGAITADKLASGSLTEGLAAEGSVIITTEQRTDLIADGFIQMGMLKELEPWTATSIINAPTPRYNHSAVWTGSEMIIFGGRGGNTDMRIGGRYDPTTDKWTATSSVNAPAGFANLNSAVWTGSEMIVWGGNAETSGGRYDPSTDSWTSISTVNAPSDRTDFTVIWTGSEMIVWGGSFNSGRDFLSTGARYNPATDTWTATSTINAPSKRRQHTAIWTGSEMIVWGGLNLGSGARYDPATDTWTATSNINAPSGRYNHTATWTGSEMIVLGGQYSSSILSDGGRYDPIADSWTAISANNAPLERSSHTAIWTGTEMIVWGGFSGDQGAQSTGARYDLITDRWTAITTSNGPGRRLSHTAIWTGSQMIVWGGNPISPQYTDTGGNYRVTEPVYFYVKP